VGKIGAVLLLLAATALAQSDARVEAAEGIDREMCERLRDMVIPRIEAFTRMKYRRPVPMRIQPRAQWIAAQKESGYAGHSAQRMAAFYSPSVNEVTIIPWAIGRYPVGDAKTTPLRKTRAEWVVALEPTLIHELVHAIHFQNFFIESRFYGTSLRMDGLSEDEIDSSTVQFLLGEGFPEFVSLRTTEYPDHMHRYPAVELDPVRRYMGVYTPDGKQPYRIILFDNGYGDSLTLLHHLFLKAGARGVRAVLYRPPPRLLLFQPGILGSVELDDPPDPDSILGFLSPEILKGHEVHLAVNPGAGRHFRSAWRSGARAKGCLIGYVAHVAGAGDYAFFVADPDRPGHWSEKQAQSLERIHPKGVKKTLARLPLMKGKGVMASLLRVRTGDRGLYVRAETDGLVVLAYEQKPTKTLADRVLAALRVLYLRRPKPRLYDAALEQARAAFKED